jgi:hypothetical protein
VSFLFLKKKKRGDDVPYVYFVCPVRYGAHDMLGLVDIGSRVGPGIGAFVGSGVGGGVGNSSCLPVDCKPSS